MQFTSLRGSVFLKNLLILVTGTGMAQAISVIVLPILQRLYSPNEFGTLHLFISITTLCTAFATLKLEYAIMLPKTEKDAVTLTVISSFATIFSSILVFIVVLLFGVTLLPGLTDAENALMLWCVPLTVLFAGLYEILTYTLNRKAEFKEMVKGKLIQNASSESFRLIGKTFLSNGGLVIGRLLGIAFSVFFLAWRSLSFKTELTIKFSEVKRILKTYRNFPLYTMPTVFISSLSNYLFINLFINYYGKYNTGVVGVANQYIALPLGIIASSFSQVFFKRIAPIEDLKELDVLYRKFSIYLFLICLPVILLTFIIPNELPSLFLGNSWNGLMAYVRLTVIWQSIAFVSSSLSFIYTKMMKQKVMFFFAIVQLILVYSSLSLGQVYSADVYHAFLYYVIGQSIYYLFTITAAFYFIKHGIAHLKIFI